MIYFVEYRDDDLKVEEDKKRVMKEDNLNAISEE